MTSTLRELEFRQKLADARRGDTDALDWLFREIAGAAEVWSRRVLGAKLRARVDPRDIAQQAMFEAHRDFAAFRGASRAEWRHWIRSIVRHSALTAGEFHCAAGKRALDRERSLDAAVEHQGPSPFLAADQTSPSGRAMRGEATERLERAIDHLPADQREAVRLRHIDGRSLHELAAIMGRSETAVAGLLKRGLRKLREAFRAVEP